MGDSFAKRQRQRKKQNKAKEKLARRLDKDDEGADGVEVVSMEELVDTREVNRRGGHDPLQELADRLDQDGEQPKAAKPPVQERAAARRARRGS